MRDKCDALAFLIRTPLPVLNLALNTGTNCQAIFLFLINNGFSEEKSKNTIFTERFPFGIMVKKYARVYCFNKVEADV